MNKLDPSLLTNAAVSSSEISPPKKNKGVDRISLTDAARALGLDLKQGMNRCPFHNDKNPSLSVDFHKETFHCFGCGRGGGVPSLVMSKTGCSKEEVGKKLRELFPELQSRPIPRTNERAFLQYPTEHLPHYDDFDKAAAVFGDEYRPIKKLLYYTVVGRHFVDKVIRHGSIFSDTRTHAIIPLPSGSGKRNLKSAVKMIGNNMPKWNVVEPTSLHPEQLVGKVVLRKKKVTNEKGKVVSMEVWVKNMGHFGDDLVVIDEAVELITAKDPETKEARAYYCIACDPYGKNEITKRSVDNLRTSDEELRYCPRNANILFMQPMKIPVEIIQRGFLRRFLVPYIKVRHDPTSIYEQRLAHSGQQEKAAQDFARWLADVPNVSEWLFMDINNVLIEYSRLLFDICVGHSERGAQYAQILSQTLLDYLLKFSVLIAGIHGDYHVREEHVRLAYLDLVELLSHTLDYVQDRTMGFIGYDSFLDQRDDDRVALEWLQQQMNMGEEVSIEVFVRKIGELTGSPVGEEFQAGTPYKVYRRLKDAGHVSSSQVGRHGSQVCAVIDNNSSEGIQGIRGVQAYNSIIKEYPEIITKILERNTLTTLNTLDPIEWLKRQNNPTTEAFIAVYGEPRLEEMLKKGDVAEMPAGHLKFLRRHF